MNNMTASTVIRSENYLLPAYNIADIARRLLKDNVLDYSNLLVFFCCADGSFSYVNRDNVKTVGGYRIKNIKFYETGMRQTTLK